MHENWTPVFIALAMAIGMRLIDVLLPKGHHLKIMDKLFVKDEEEEDESG